MKNKGDVRGQMLRRRQRPSGRAVEMFHSAKSRAERKGLEFSISVEDIKRRFERGVCEATGIEFDFETVGQGKSVPFAPSIDRKDARKGYTPTNVQVVVVIHNYARGRWGDAPLKRYMLEYIRHLRRKV